MTKEERINHWRSIITEHASSGMSAAAFCRQHDLNIPQFRWWHRRFKQEKSQGSGFLQLVPFSKSQHSGIRIRLHNDISIEVERGFDPQTLRDVIATIHSEETPQCSR